MFELYLNIGMEYANGTKTNGGQKGHKKYQEVKPESSSSTGTDALHVLYFAFSFRIRTTHFSKGELEVRLLLRLLFVKEFYRL